MAIEDCRDYQNHRPEEVGALLTQESERRSDILQAIQRVFDAHGCAGTTMDQVAEEVGVSKVSLNNYFAGKEDLFEKVFHLAMDEVDAETARLLDDVHSRRYPGPVDPGHEREN